MFHNDYWRAVQNDDIAALEHLLAQSPSLVHETIPGEAWQPGHWYDPAAGKRVPVPHDFLFSNTALHTAAVNGHAELASLLLRHGANPNAIGYEANKGLTPPIVLAAWEGTLETLRALLDAGADPNLPASAETALYTAAEHGSRDKAELLLSRGARHDIFTAAILGEVETVRQMLHAYPPLKDAKSHKRRRTPMEEAQHHHRADVVKLLERAT
jgi:ankyrin repeat protein